MCSHASKASLLHHHHHRRRRRRFLSPSHLLEMSVGLSHTQDLIQTRMNVHNQHHRTHDAPPYSLSSYSIDRITLELNSFREMASTPSHALTARDIQHAFTSSSSSSNASSHAHLESILTAWRASPSSSSIAFQLLNDASITDVRCCFHAALTIHVNGARNRQR